MSYELIEQETVYRGKVFNVRRDQVRTPTGHLVALDIVEHRGAVTLIPLDDAGQIVFVRQYRHAAGMELLELPAGAMEVDEDPEECARREIREETGMAAASLVRVGQFFLAPGYSTEYMHVFLASGLYPDPLPGDVDELLTLETVPVQQVFQLIVEGQIRDAKSLAALTLARAYLE